MSEPSDSGHIEVFTMFRRLRKCRRCGHFPCPCCVDWCDVTHIDKDEPGAVRVDDHAEDCSCDEHEYECPCYADDCKCWWTADDHACNTEVFQIFWTLCEQTGIDITGMGTTEDGRLVASGDLNSKPGKSRYRGAPEFPILRARLHHQILKFRAAEKLDLDPLVNEPKHSKEAALELVRSLLLHLEDT